MKYADKIHKYKIYQRNINNLDPVLREAIISQIRGNTKLENLLEVIAVKMLPNPLNYDDHVGSSAMSISERWKSVKPHWRKY